MQENLFQILCTVFRCGSRHISVQNVNLFRSQWLLFGFSMFWLNPYELLTCTHKWKPKIIISGYFELGRLIVTDLNTNQSVFILFTVIIMHFLCAYVKVSECIKLFNNFACCKQEYTLSFVSVYHFPSNFPLQMLEYASGQCYFKTFAFFRVFVLCIFFHTCLYYCYVPCFACWKLKMTFDGCNIGNWCTCSIKTVSCMNHIAFFMKTAFWMAREFHII